MDMSTLDLGQILAVLALFYKLSADKADHAEQMGRIKSQIEHLENRAGTVDSRLDNIDTKLEKLIASAVRLEALLNTSHKPLATPSPLAKS
tara:strand:- start:185 stop:457 length:273 start_codon:yes stop_codon:yes gene_type:complete